MVDARPSPAPRDLREELPRALAWPAPVKGDPFTPLVNEGSGLRLGGSHPSCKPANSCKIVCAISMSFDWDRVQRTCATRISSSENNGAVGSIAGTSSSSPAKELREVKGDDKALVSSVRLHIR